MSITNEALIERLIQSSELEGSIVRELMERVLSGSMPPAQIAAILALLRGKKESATTLQEAAGVVLHKAVPLKRPDFLFADIVGTGGDGHNTINVSTLASFTAASLSLPVAKHGNASVSSKCGSADLLALWGVNLNLSPCLAMECLERNKWCFLFAPNYHPTFKLVKPIRQELRIKTIFNILGPLVNPSSPPIMLVGVYDPNLLMPFALALKNLGHRRTLIVHGSGLDEIALHGPTEAVLTDDRTVEKITITPKMLGLSSFSMSAIVGNGPETNADFGEAILSGRGNDAKTSLVAASAGVLLWLGEKANTKASGVELAKSALKSGLPLKVLDEVRRFGDGS